MAGAQKGLDLKLMNENMTSEGLKKEQTARQGWPGSRPDRDAVTKTGAWPSEGTVCPALLSVLSPVHVFTPYRSLGGSVAATPFHS